MRSQGFKSPHLHPHLVTRVSNADAPIDSVILSGHSQGAVAGSLVRATPCTQVVRDPTALRPDPGKVTDPRIENHSNYQRYLAYTTIRDAAAQDLIAPPPR